jgi:predicted transposase/invertase (TIGR01784 family)
MLLMANAPKTREVLKMSDMATIDEVFEGLGIIEYYEARGEARGKEEGREEGKEEGREKGKEEGREEGKEEKALQIARNLKKIGLPPEQIIEVTGLTERQINDL